MFPSVFRPRNRRGVWLQLSKAYFVTFPPGVWFQLSKALVLSRARPSWRAADNALCDDTRN